MWQRVELNMDIGQLDILLETWQKSVIKVGHISYQFEERKIILVSILSECQSEKGLKD